MFLLIHCLIPVISIMIIKISYGRVISFSFVHIFLYSFLFLIYLRALDVYEMIENIHFIISVWAIPLIVALVASYVKIIILKSTYTFSLKVNNLHFNKIDNFLYSRIHFFSLTFLFIIGVFIVDIGFSNIALFTLFNSTNNSIEVMNQRISGLTSNITPLLTYIYSYSRALIFPLYFSFLSILLAHKKIGKGHYLIIMIAGIFFCLSTTAKSPVVIFLVSGLLGYNFAIEGRLKINKIAIRIITVLLIPAAIYPLLYSTSGLNSLVVLFDSLWRRLTWVPSYASGVYFDYFSNLDLKIGFSSNKTLSFLTHQEYINIPSYIYENYFETTIQGGLVNASYFASFYADWGIYGVIFSTIFISVLLVSLDNFFKHNNTFFYAAGKVIVILGMIHLMLSNFYSVSLGRGFLSIPLLLFILKTISKKDTYFPVQGNLYKGVNNEIKKV